MQGKSKLQERQTKAGEFKKKAGLILKIKLWLQKKLAELIHGLTHDRM
jgi:hypothetical protein